MWDEWGQMTTFEEPCCRGGAESGMAVLPATPTDNAGEERSNVAQRVMALIKSFLKYPIMSYLAGTVMGGVTENRCNTTAISKYCQNKTDFYCYQCQLLLIYLVIFSVGAHGRHLTLFCMSAMCSVDLQHASLQCNTINCFKMLKNGGGLSLQHPVIQAEQESASIGIFLVPKWKAKLVLRLHPLNTSHIRYIWIRVSHKYQKQDYCHDLTAFGCPTLLIVQREVV